MHKKIYLNGALAQESVPKDRFGKVSYITAGYQYYGKRIGRVLDFQTYEYRRGGISDLFFY